MKENMIKIQLKTNNCYRNEYNKEKLSSNLFTYILDEAKSASTKQKIKFIVTSEFDLDDKEKDNLVDMIRNSFGTDVSEIMNIAKKQNITNWLIFIVGFIFLIIYTFSKTNFLSEFTLILGWVFLGESICNFLYNGIENNLKIRRRKQIINAKVIFK